MDQESRRSFSQSTRIERQGAALIGTCLLGIALTAAAFAQQAPPAPAAAPEQDELFWCKQQRNFFADNAASNASTASKLDKEVIKLRAEIEELKKKAPGGGDGK